MKHYHKMALDNAIHTGCYNFNKVEFLAAIRQIRQKAFKRTTIIHAWRDTGLVPYNPEVVLSKIRVKQVTPPPKETESITREGFPTPRTPRSLAKIGKQLIRRMQVTKAALDRYIRGAEFQAFSGTQAKEALAHTQAAEKARQARAKRKESRIQKGGVLCAGDWRKIQHQKEQDQLAIAEQAEVEAIARAKQEREKVQKQ
jgi:gamma-glutamylcysteine synthetase